jgi:hypothetical protein
MSAGRKASWAPLRVGWSFEIASRFLKIPSQKRDRTDELRPEHPSPRFTLFVSTVPRGMV